MPWQDRLREAAYTSPSGIRTVFMYENVSEEFDKKTSAFDFPDANGTYIQDLGKTGRRYPLKLIFSGDNYDEEASFFSSLLGETGVGRLETPLYGTINVVVFGRVSRRDDLKTAGNQAIFSVTFWETSEALFPSPQESPGDTVISELDAFNDAMAETYATETDLTTVAKRVTALNRIQNLLDNTKNGLQAVADTVANVQKQFDAIFESINSSIDLLIETPLVLAQQIVNLIQSPARAGTAIQARLDAYKNLADTTLFNIENVFNIYSPDVNNANSNDFHNDDVYASGYMTGSVLSVMNNTFSTASDAIEAAESLLNQFDDLVEWRDLNYAALSEIDTGEAYQKLSNAVALAVGFLVQISFTVKQERSITLTHPRTIIDLVAELYGEIDSQLDFLITSNNLTGSEILELPKGRTIVYYV